MIRILLVDDQQAVRRGLQLRLGLEPDLAIVGEVGTIREALVLAQALLPDVIVLDIGMQATGGIDTIQRLRDAAPDSAVVVLTLRDDTDSRRWAREAGTRAFIVKQGGADGLLQAIRRAKEP